MAIARAALEAAAALRCEPERIRNICVLAHVDHGKTRCGGGARARGPGGG